MLAFLHIPKTAGTTVREAIAEATGRIGADGFDLSAFGSLFRTAGDDLPYRDRIFRTPEEFPRECGIFSGHVALSNLLAAYPDARAFTILREPRSRLLSLWLFWRAYADDRIAPWGPWAERLALARGRFHDFLSDPRIACQTDNVCVRMLTFPHAALPEDDFIPAESDAVLLQRARAALGSLGFVGCTEDPALGARLSRFLNAPIRLDHRNATATSEAASTPVLTEELDDATLAALRERTRLDSVLWAETVQGLGLPPGCKELAEASLLRRSLHYVGKGIAYASPAGRDAAQKAARREAEARQVADRDAEARIALVKADAARAEADAARAEADAARAAADAARAEAEASRSRLEAAFKAAEAARAAAEARLLALETSTSWRITAPFRRASNRLRARSPSTAQAD